MSSRYLPFFRDIAVSGCWGLRVLGLKAVRGWGIGFKGLGFWGSGGK